MLRQKLKRISLILDIGEPVEVGEGVFKTSLFHPKLDGELYFVHSKLGGRDETLKAIDENIVGHMLDMVNVIGGIVNGTTNAATGASSETTSEKGHQG